MDYTVTAFNDWNDKWFAASDVGSRFSDFLSCFVLYCCLNNSYYIGCVKFVLYLFI